MKIQLPHTFEEMISPENLFAAWMEFVRGKRRKPDVQEFERDLIDHIIGLHKDLKNGRYIHGTYHSFIVTDPKRRHIHKASVRDRLIHHAVHRILYPFYDRTFIADSFSCRNGKGLHKAMNQFREFGFRASKNNTRTCWVLQCDIRKYFGSIDHRILQTILAKRIPDSRILGLLTTIIQSYQTDGLREKGVPLGNLTSQLFANIYLDVFDQWMKHVLKIQYYVRYADDFLLLSADRKELERLIPTVSRFLSNHLSLCLHPQKVHIRSIASGVDFLGWVHFPDHRVLRGTTGRRMLRSIEQNPNPASIQSYLGLLSHGNAYKFKKALYH